MNGSKEYEFRKKIFKNHDIKSVIVYSTMPVGKIVGEFTFKNILHGSPEYLWGVTKEKSGITKSYFDLYFDNKLEAFALQIDTVYEYGERFHPREVVSNFTPPQSFMYIDEYRYPEIMHKCQASL